SSHCSPGSRLPSPQKGSGGSVVSSVSGPSVASEPEVPSPVPSSSPVSGSEVSPLSSVPRSLDPLPPTAGSEPQPTSVITADSVHEVQRMAARYSMRKALSTSKWAWRCDHVRVDRGAAMSTSLLITQCLQNDFVKPIGRFDAIPNQLHVGHAEALRLLGETPSEGPIERVMQWAYAQSDELVRVVHIRDWHDPDAPDQRSHLALFG